MKRVFPLLAASVLSLGVMSCSDDGDDKKDSGSAVDPLKAKLSGTWMAVKSVDADNNETVYSLTPGDNEELAGSLWEYTGDILKIHELVDSESYLYVRTAEDKFEYITEGTEPGTRTVDYTITANTITGDFDGDSETPDETVTYKFSENMDTLIETTEGTTYYSVKYAGTNPPAEWDDYLAANPLDGMSKTDLLGGTWEKLTETGGGDDEPADEYTSVEINNDGSLLDLTLKRKKEFDGGSYRTAAGVVSLGDIDLKKISNIIVSYEVANEGDTVQLHFSNIKDGGATSLDNWAGDQAYATYYTTLSNGKAGQTVTDTICVADMSLFWWGGDNAEDTKAVEDFLNLQYSTEDWGKWAPYYNYNEESNKTVNNLHLLEKEKFVFITNYNDDWKTADESFNVKISKFEVLSMN